MCTLLQYLLGNRCFHHLLLCCNWSMCWLLFFLPFYWIFEKSESYWQGTVVESIVYYITTPYLYGVGINMHGNLYAYSLFYWKFQKIGPEVSAQLLEYDKRFEQYGTEFTFYDYNQPDDLPLSLKHSFPIIVADPPYLVKVYLVAPN